MSVPKPLRNESSMQFVEVARQLDIYVAKHYNSFMRRYFDKKSFNEYYVLSQMWEKLWNWSTECYNNVQTANKVFIAHEADVQRRANLFDEALQCVISITSQLHVVEEVWPDYIKQGTINTISDFCEDEKRLLVAMKKSDRKFLRNMKAKQNS